MPERDPYYVEAGHDHHGAVWDVMVHTTVRLDGEPGVRPVVMRHGTYRTQVEAEAERDHRNAIAGGEQQ